MNDSIPANGQSNQEPGAVRADASPAVDSRWSRTERCAERLCDDFNTDVPKELHLHHRHVGYIGRYPVKVFQDLDCAGEWLVEPLPRTDREGYTTHEAEVFIQVLAMGASIADVMNTKQRAEREAKNQEALALTDVAGGETE